ncbi:CHAT domain-domain-containing protein, partial [Clohesyomyces aquaticus]
LDQAIDYAQRAEDLTASGSPYHGECLHFLSTLMRERYKVSGSLQELHSAIRAARLAKDFAKEQPQHEGDLVLHDRYARKGELKDLNTGIDLARAVLRKTPRTYPQYVRRSQVLGNLLHTLYERTGKTEFLQESIKIAEDVTQRSSFQIAVADQALHYNNLATRLHSLYHETRDRADIQRAIDYATLAVSSSRISHQDVLLLINLSSVYATRSAALGALKDLDEAIRIMSVAIEKAPPNHAAWALDIFANTLFKKYLRDDNPVTLNMAAAKHSEALALTPDDHPLKPGFIYNAQHVATLQHLSAPDLPLLCEAIKMATNSVGNWNGNDHDKGAVIHELARLNGLLFRFTRGPGTLQLAISQAEEALRLCRNESTYKSSWYRTLGELLLCLYGSTEERNEEYHTTAIDNFIKGLHHKASLLRDRCSSGSMAGQLLAQDARWPEAASVLQSTLELVSRLSPRELDWDDQQFHLKNMSGLSSLAASAILEAGSDAVDALTLLEAGRGLMGRIAIGLRSDLQDLQLANSKIAVEYADLRNRLATLSETQVPRENGPDSFVYAPGTDPVSQRLEIAESLDKLDNKIRAEIPGFSNFLQPKPASTFPALVKSTSHAVVAFNVTTYRSDAFLVTTKRVTHLPLRNLLWTNVEALAKMLVGPSRLTNGDLESLHSRNQQLRDALRTLWFAAVKPVLEELGFLSPETERALPRVTWITSGLVGLLPIHAAGSSWDNGRENTASHVISSYAPTFQALEASQAKATRSNVRAARKVLAVAMPETTGWKPLSIRSEVERLRGLVRSQLFSLEGERASKEAVLKHLGDAAVVYFGCHADSNAENPSGGGFYLRDGPDGKPEKLTVRDLARINLPQARLAYLSACSTAENLSQQLRDEVIHLASTLQLVGIPSVVGTMWAADDKTANQVSRLFFEHVVEQEKHLADLGSENGQVDYALAIHEATWLVRQGRAGGGRRRRNASDNVTAWGPFIHIG